MLIELMHLITFAALQILMLLQNIDPMQVQVSWAWQIARDPIMSNFIQAVSNLEQWIL